MKILIDMNLSPLWVEGFGDDRSFPFANSDLADRLRRWFTIANMAEADGSDGMILGSAIIF